MDVFRDDVKSGIFILLAILIFLLAVFKVGGVLDRWQAGREIVLDFKNSQQVDAGAEVLYRGKKIGRVTAVAFSSDGTSVHVTCSVAPDTPLYHGTKARISDKSALGGKLVELIPPASRPGEVLTELAVDEIIPGMPASGLAAAIENVSSLLKGFRDGADRIFPKLEAAIQHFDTAILSVQNQVDGFGALKPKLETTLDTYHHLALQLDSRVTELTARIQAVLDTAEPTVQQIGTDFNALTGQLRTDLAEVKQQTSLLLQHADQLVLDANALIAGNNQDLTEIVLSLKQASRGLKMFTDRIAARPYLVLRKGGDVFQPIEDSDEEIFDQELRRTGRIGRKGLDADQDKNP